MPKKDEPNAANANPLNLKKFPPYYVSEMIVKGLQEGTLFKGNYLIAHLNAQ